MQKILVGLLLLLAARVGLAQNYSVTLTWTASASNTATTPTLVNVYRGVTATTSCAGMTWVQIATAQPAGGPYVDATVVDGVHYCYEVRAYFNAPGLPTNESSGSNWAYVPIPAPASPVTPTGLVGKVAAN